MSTANEEEYLKYRRKQERLFVKGEVSFNEFLVNIGSYYRNLLTDELLSTKNPEFKIETQQSQSRL